MNKKELRNLLTEISVADLKVADNEQLSEWYNGLHEAINDKKLAESLDRNTLESWKKQFDRLNKTFEERGITRIDLLKWMNDDPESLSFFLSLQPEDELQELEKNVRMVQNKDFVKRFLEILQFSKGLRVSYYFVDSQLPS